MALAQHKTAPIEALHITNRNLARAEELADIIRRSSGFSSVEAAPSDADRSTFDIIINATSLGLKDDDPLPFSLDGLSPDCLICDIIMVPERTRLLVSAEAAGFAIHYGKHMFDYQMRLIGKFIGALPE